ncbi:hypothetical protein SGRI78S_01441 [Streptomyces griseus subsp. griseus]
MSTSEEISTLLVTKFGTDPGAIRPDVPLHRLRLDSLALEESSGCSSRTGWTWTWRTWR